MTTQYAKRGSAKRIKMSVVLKPHIVRFLQSAAKHSGRSVNAVVEDLIEGAIYGEDTAKKEAV